MSARGRARHRDAVDDERALGAGVGDELSAPSPPNSRSAGGAAHAAGLVGEIHHQQRGLLGVDGHRLELRRRREAWRPSIRPRWSGRRRAAAHAHTVIKASSTRPASRNGAWVPPRVCSCRVIATARHATKPLYRFGFVVLSAASGSSVSRERLSRCVLAAGVPAARAFDLPAIRSARATGSPQCRPIPPFRCSHGRLGSPCLAALVAGSMMAGSLPDSRAEGAPPHARYRLPIRAAGAGKVAAVIDGRSFLLDDGREVRLAAIEVPLLPAPGETGPRRRGRPCRAGGARGDRGRPERRAAPARGAAAVADRYGRIVAHVHVTENGPGYGARIGRARDCWRRAMRGSPPRSGTAPAPPSSWPGNAPPARQSLACGANRIMP